MSDTGGTDSSSEGPSIVDPVGFVGSGFDPGVWVLGEADPFGEVWVNVESGVVVGSLGGAVIDPSEIDGVVEIEEMPAGLFGSEDLADMERVEGGYRDVEFDPEMGAFVADEHVVGWTEDADSQVGWVEGVGYYHAGTGQWYSPGLEVVDRGMAEGGRYLPFDELHPRLQEQILADAGIDDAEAVDGAFFDPVTETLHSYDPEAWVYDGSTWVNLENGATADSPTTDRTGYYDPDDLETLQEQAEGESAAEAEPAREEAGTEPVDVTEDESEPDATVPEETQPLESEEIEAEPIAPEADNVEPTDAATDVATAVEGEPESVEIHEPEVEEASEDLPTAEIGEPEPLEAHEPDAGDESSPAVAVEPEPEVIVAPTETPIADIYDPGSEPEEPESLEERTAEAYEPQTGGPIGGGSPLVKDEPETMEGVEPDAVVAEPKPGAAASEPEPVSTTEPSAAQTTKPEPELGEAGGSSPADVTKPVPEPDVDVSPPPAYSSPPDLGSLHDEYEPDPSDDGLTAEEFTEAVNAAQDTESVDPSDEALSGETPGHDLPGWVPEPSPAPAGPTKPEPETRVTVSPPETVAPVPDLDGDHPMEHLLTPERRGTEDASDAPLPEDSESAMAQKPPEAPTVDFYEPESGSEPVAAPTEGFSTELHEPEPETETPAAGRMRGAPGVEVAPIDDEPEPEILEAPTDVPAVDIHEPEPEPVVVVAPTDVPVVDVYEPESTEGPAADEPGLKEPFEPSRAFTPPAVGESADQPEVVVAPTETPTVDIHESDAEPEVVVAPTDVPVVDVSEPESTEDSAADESGLKEPFEPSRAFTPPAVGESADQPEVVVAPTETPTAELYEPEPEPEVVVAPTETPAAEVYESEPDPLPEIAGVGRMREAPVMEPAPDEPESEPEVIVAPTETPTAELYEPESDPGSSAWKGLDVTEVGAATDRAFGEWTPVESSRSVPSDPVPVEVVSKEPIADSGEDDLGRPEVPVQDQTEISWDAVSELEVGEFEVEPVLVETLEIVAEPAEPEAIDVIGAGVQLPTTQGPPDVLRELPAIEIDVVAFEEPMEELGDDVSAMADMELEPLPLKDVEPLDLADVPDADGEDYLDE
jgi:hypothetical protein